MTTSIPAQPGTYALILAADAHETVQIGRLGALRLQPGYYVYVGSAFGPGGLRARVGRHRGVAGAPGGRLHWHVDYLRRVTQLRQIWGTMDPARREHQWAHCVGQLPNASAPRRGFGSSDCGCVTHLYYVATCPNIDTFRRTLCSAWPQHAPVFVHHVA